MTWRIDPVEKRRRLVGQGPILDWSVIREGSHNSRTKGSSPSHSLSKIRLPMVWWRLELFQVRNNQYESQEECDEDQET
jgi:hypothetical protein